MIKLLLLIFFLTIYAPIFAQNPAPTNKTTPINNNTTIATPTEDYSKQIRELEFANKALTEKVETLNEANNKILNTVYWAMGVIIAGVFGFSIWNTVKTQKLDNQKIRISLDNAKKELMESIDKKVEKKSFSDLSGIKSDIYTLKYNVYTLKQNDIIRKISNHISNRHLKEFELDALFELIDLQLAHNDNFGLESTLKAIKDFLDTNPFVSDSDKHKLLQYLDKHFTSERFKYQVTDIRDMVSKLNETT